MDGEPAAFSHADAARRRQPSAWVAAVALLAALAGNSEVHAQTIRIGGTGSAIGTMQRLGEAYRKTDPSFRLDVLPNLGSSGGIKALSVGGIQIAAISRPLKPVESATGLRAIEYGRTAFVLASSQDTTRNLTMGEVAALYAGKRTHWSDGTPVRLVLRPTSDGDTELLAAFSPEVRAALEQAQRREGMVLGMTDQETVDAIERLPGGAGYGVDGPVAVRAAPRGAVGNRWRCADAGQCGQRPLPACQADVPGVARRRTGGSAPIRRIRRIRRRAQAADGIGPRDPQHRRSPPLSVAGHRRQAGPERTGPWNDC